MLNLLSAVGLRSGALVSRCRMSSDEKKVAFALDALNAPDVFQSTVQSHRDVLNAIDWRAGETDTEIMQFRDALLAGCEAAGVEM